ncbi:MAG TPA: DedA family protein [Anaerolineales bacterium]|nr:DedA family protein [Anaerolineales bacterium]
MALLQYLSDLILHLDKHMAAIISQYGAWTYAILFVIIFIETGVVIFPFLPGDSLLFAAGTFAALGALNIWVLWGLLALAAILGDSVNYFIGHFLGDRAYNTKWIKREYLDRTHGFFDKYGRKTIFLARFVPIVRTFAPFVAGIGNMSYPAFISYNVFGGIAWTGLFLWAGYFFGNIPFIRDHFSLVVLAIILISITPMIYEAVKARRESRQAKAAAVETP